MGPVCLSLLPCPGLFLFLIPASQGPSVLVLRPRRVTYQPWQPREQLGRSSAVPTLARLCGSELWVPTPLLRVPSHALLKALWTCSVTVAGSRVNGELWTQVAA